MARVTWTVTALDGLESISDYIARDSAVYAAAFVQRVFAAAESLEALPLRGRVVPEHGVESLRELIFQGYRIVYEIDGQDVRIMMIVHGARVLPPIEEREPWDLP